MFSYVCLNEINLMLEKLSDEREEPVTDENLLTVLHDKYGMTFDTLEEATDAFNTFLYRLIDIYGESRGKLIMMGNKILERINRTDAYLSTVNS